jgi:hypothetical protein
LGIQNPKNIHDTIFENLISSSFIKISAIFTKPHKTHGLTFKIGKKQMKEINKKMHKKNGNVLRHLPLH